MTLFIQASNIHGGGGKTLLLPLLSAISQPCTVFVDARLDDIPSLHPDVRLVAVRPTLTARLHAELELAKKASTDDVILCFGNLPPLFPSKAKVHLYLQNRYLVDTVTTADLPVKVRVRIWLERIWLKMCIRQASVMVQTASMATKVEKALGCSASVVPFAPRFSPRAEGDSTCVYDYVYIASGEAHKNHRRLVEAWEFLKARGAQPSLCLTLNSRRDSALRNWVAERARIAELSIQMEEVSDPEAVSGLLARSRALVFPSLFESFGLPLLEADNAGLPIVASERDYVRDIVAPSETFDPESAVSIARAVMRHSGNSEKPAEMYDEASFLAKLKMNL